MESVIIGVTVGGKFKTGVFRGVGVLIIAERNPSLASGLTEGLRIDWEGGCKTGWQALTQ